MISLKTDINRYYYFRRSIQIDKRTAASIWRPIITFENMKTSKSVRQLGLMDSFVFKYDVNQSGQARLMYAEQYELTFTCPFELKSFPFDSHKCPIEFGDLWEETRKLNLSATTVTVRGQPSITPEDGPMILNVLMPYPYEFQLEALPAFEINVNGEIYSFTGALLTLKRKSLGHLMSGYYYPTTAFALLSMISYLIDADIVSFLVCETKTFVNKLEKI